MAISPIDNMLIDMSVIADYFISPLIMMVIVLLVILLLKLFTPMHQVRP